MISLTVNGNEVRVDASMSIERLLKTVDVPANYLAVEINENVVPRELHGEHMVVDGDRIEVVTLVGGG